MAARDADEVLAAFNRRACSGPARALLRLTAAGCDENSDNSGSGTP